MGVWPFQRDMKVYSAHAEWFHACILRRYIKMYIIRSVTDPVCYPGLVSDLDNLAAVDIDSSKRLLQLYIH